MPPIPLKPGVYKLHAHIVGPSSLVTATEYAVKYGAPVITDRSIPSRSNRSGHRARRARAGSALHDSPRRPRDRGLVIAEDKLWVNSVPSSERARFTFEPVLGGVKILSEKGLAWSASHRGAQIELTPPKPEFQQTWTLEFVRPTDE